MATNQEKLNSLSRGDKVEDLMVKVDAINYSGRTPNAIQGHDNDGIAWMWNLPARNYRSSGRSYRMGQALADCLAPHDYWAYNNFRDTPRYVHISGTVGGAIGNQRRFYAGSSYLLGFKLLRPKIHGIYMPADDGQKLVKDSVIETKICEEKSSFVKLMSGVL